jgi:CoA:oxalate CoA-transferase
MSAQICGGEGCITLAREQVVDRSCKSQNLVDRNVVPFYVVVVKNVHMSNKVSRNMSQGQPNLGGRPLPLRGITVVDFTTFLSGPFCTQILGDLGATIIKIEPFCGDSSRNVPPHFVEEDSAYFISTNRNKKSIALDLKNSAGVKTARRLVLAADVVIENFRPGVCAKLGIDAQQILQKKPELIWASISGFGQTGPRRNDPAYDMIVQALSGAMSITGEVGRPSVRLGIPAGDLVAGMYAAIAINALLVGRSQTKKGGYIDISMLDGLLSMLSYQAQYHLVADTVPGPQAARHDSIPTYRSFLAGDGLEFVVTANTQRMWTKMCDVVGRHDLLVLPEFADASARHLNKEALWAELEMEFKKDKAGVWVARLMSLSVPAALIRNVPEAIADARAAERNMVVTARRCNGQSIEMINTPIRISGVTSPCVFPPKLSQDCDEILQTILGLSVVEAERLAESGALLRPEKGKIEMKR